MVDPTATGSRVNCTPFPGVQGCFGTTVTVVAANLSRPAFRELRDRRGFAAPRSIGNFSTVTPAVARSFNKARSNLRDECSSATTRLTARATVAFCALLDSVAGDTTPTCSPQCDIQPQNRGFLPKRGLSALHLDNQPMRASLARMPTRLLEHGSPGGPGAAHGYPG